MASRSIITRRAFSSALVTTTLLGGATPHAIQLDAVIPLRGIEGRIDHFSVDTRRGRLFIAALGNGSVEVVDWKAGKVLHSIVGLQEPQGLVYVSEANQLYIATGGDGTLRIYDATSFRNVATVRLGSDADNVRFDPASKRIYVGYGEGALAVLDVNGKLEAQIVLTAHPESFQMEHNGPRLYVNVPDSKHIAVVDRERRSVIARWNTAGASANFPMALDERNRRLFVVCRKPARLLIFDTGSGDIMQVLQTAGDADDIFFDASRNQLYVTGGEGVIAVYNCHKDGCKERARIISAAGARTSLFVADWDRLFIAVPHRGATQPAQLQVYTVA